MKYAWCKVDLSLYALQACPVQFVWCWLGGHFLCWLGWIRSSTVRCCLSGQWLSWLQLFVLRQLTLCAGWVCTASAGGNGWNGIGPAGQCSGGQWCTAGQCSAGQWYPKPYGRCMGGSKWWLWAWWCWIVCSSWVVWWWCAGDRWRGRPWRHRSHYRVL